jgi:hypothetical protein
MVETIYGKASTEAYLEPRIMIEYTPGHWGKVFHIFDLDNREISLHQKDAIKLAKNILKIAKEDLCQ